MNTHFARVLPIIGSALFGKRVAIVGFPEAEPVVRYLAANGISKWIWLCEDERAMSALYAGIVAQHGDALPLDVATKLLAGIAPDLVIAVGADTWQQGEVLAALTGVPLLPVSTRNGWDWRCAAPLVAFQARNIMLARPVVPLPPPLDSPFLSPTRPQGRLLVAGLGSLGSVALNHLAPFLKAIVAADADVVDEFNPVRQAFPLRMVGQNKAMALAQLFGNGRCDFVPIPHGFTDEREIYDLVMQYKISAALVTTGTNADFAIARALSAAGIPHVVGRCYPRARYWEAIVVDGDGSSFEEIRGHVRAGPSPTPTPEQRRAYSDAGALEAEPATLIESGWAAAWMARLVHQIMVPPALRELWLLRHLAVRQSCFIGGLHVEETPKGAAYGIERFGHVRAFAPQSVRK